MTSGTCSLSVLCAAGLCLLYSVAASGDEFILNFDGSALLGEAGATATGDVRATLRHDNPEGNRLASGWSFSAVADNAAITAITTDGTVAEASEFNQTELTTRPGSNECEGLTGVISAVVLALIDDVTLPDGTTHDVAIVTIEATIPDGGGTASLRYVDGCVGSGQPVDNVITQAGDSNAPTRFSTDIPLTPIVCFCASEVTLAFSADPVDGGSPIFTDAIGVGDFDPANPCAGTENCAAAGSLEIGVTPGSTAQGQVCVNIVSQIPADANHVSGWSLSLKFDDLGFGSALSSVTTDGTSAADGEFNQTEVIDPANNNGMQGAVSAVVLALIDDVSLAAGQSTVLCMNFEARLPDTTGGGAGLGPVASVFPLDGLRGSGQPVDNVATVGGDSLPFANADTARTDVLPVIIDFTPFVRGDANDDTKVNLADAIWVINFLFKSGDPSPCEDAADSNDNGVIELADAQLLISYIFPAAASEFGIEVTPPATPFPDCGLDPSDEESDEGDGLPCESSSGC